MPQAATLTAHALTVTERRHERIRSDRRPNGALTGSGCCPRCSTRHEAAEAERRRLERNLHDGAQQRLVALSLRLALLARGLAPDSEPARQLAVARDELTASLAELRDLARGLHPVVLGDHGLVAALESLAARAPLAVQLAVDVQQPAPAAVEAAAYYLVSEALTNVAKYAAATTATVTVARADDRLVIEVADDGVGGADPAAGSGLRGLADRVEALGGRLCVRSPAAQGTTVRAELPCRPIAAAGRRA